MSATLSVFYCEDASKPREERHRTVLPTAQLAKEHAREHGLTAMRLLVTSSGTRADALASAMAIFAGDSRVSHAYRHPGSWRTDVLFLQPEPKEPTDEGEPVTNTGSCTRRGDSYG
jgi:hypothetical protein